MCIEWCPCGRRTRSEAPSQRGVAQISGATKELFRAVMEEDTDRLAELLRLSEAGEAASLQATNAAGRTLLEVARERDKDVSVSYLEQRLLVWRTIAPWAMSDGWSTALQLSRSGSPLPARPQSGAAGSSSRAAAGSGGREHQPEQSPQQQELSRLTKRQLRQRAQQAGADPARIERAIASSTPKADLISLVMSVQATTWAEFKTGSPSWAQYKQQEEQEQEQEGQEGQEEAAETTENPIAGAG